MKHLALAALLAAALASASPAAAVTVRARWASNDPSWASLGILQDGVLVRGDLLTAAVACPAPNTTQKCIDLAAPTARGTTVQYTLRACNTWSECATSNSVGLPVPVLPGTPALSIDVAP